MTSNLRWRVVLVLVVLVLSAWRASYTLQYFSMTDEAKDQMVPEQLEALEGRSLRHTLDLDKRQVRITPVREMIGRRGRLRVDFANVFGQHVLHPRIELGG